MKRALSCLLLVACSTGNRPGPDAGTLDAGAADASEACDMPDTTRCSSGALERCSGGAWRLEQTCPVVCEPVLGCVDCLPSARRTCIANEVRACTDEGLIGGVIEACDADHPCSDGYCGGCAANTDLIYLLDAGAHLFSYDPRTNALVDLGGVHCPLVNAEASPYSMAVDRRGQAWVLFDSGEIFLVDIADTSCRASGFTPDQENFHTFGMGFVSDALSSPEVLYVAGGPDISSARTDTRLATIDLDTLQLEPIASLTTLDAYFPELSGDGAGGLYGYFPSTMTFPSRVSTIRRETARIGPTWDAVRIDPGASSISAWAFARWGGAFYLFVTITDIGGIGGPGDSEFYRLDPETGELTLLRFDFHAFVGAGVSTCAPLLI